MVQIGQLAWKLSAVSPFFVVLSLGLQHNRANGAHHSFPSYTVAENQVLLSYVPVYREGDDMPFTFARTQPNAVRKCVSDWVEGYESGRLKPLKFAFYSEQTEIGPRYDILAEWTRLAGMMQQVRDADEDRKQFGAAVKDTILIMRFGEAVKPADLPHVYSGSIIQTHALRNIVSHWGELTASERAELRKSVKGILAHRIDLQNLVRENEVGYVSFMNSEQRIELAEASRTSTDWGESNSVFDQPVDEFKLQEQLDINTELEWRKEAHQVIDRLDHSRFA